MNILYLSVSYPQGADKENLYTMLIRRLAQEGHKITVVVAEEEKNINETQIAFENKIEVLRVKVGDQFGVNSIKKGITFLKIEPRLIQAINKYLGKRKFDLVLYATPPVAFANVIRLCKRRYHCKSYLMLKDIFPQNAVDIGLLRENSLMHKYFRAKEKKLYQISDYIGCMSQANVDYVIKHNPFIEANKIEICPNSIEPLDININVVDKKKIRNKYGIPEDKTVFVYGGNLGKPQGIDFLMQCLKTNENNNEAFILITGSGTEYERLKEFFNKEELKNSKLFSHIPKDDYDLLVNTCDVGLIFLDNRFTVPNFPSRLLSYMQASIPVLAFTDRSTDIGKVIEEGEFGCWEESGDLGGFRRNIDFMCNDLHLRETMGINARRYLEENYTVKHSYDIIMKHFI